MSFFDAAQVLLAVRAVVQYCVKTEIPESAPNPDLFAQVLVALSDYLNLAEPDDADDDWVLRNILPDVLFRSEEHTLNAHARWRLLLDEIPSALQSSLAGRWVDLEGEFFKATGVAKSEFRAVVVGLHAMLSDVSSKWDIRRPGLLARWETWFRNHRLEENEARVIDEICATPEALAAEFSHRPALEAAPYDFLPLRRHPIVRLGNLGACPNLDFLLDLASAGIYHRLFSYYLSSHDDGRRQRLSDFLGLVFQEYVFRLTRTSHGGIGADAVTRTDEPDSDHSTKRCDLAVVEGSRVTLLECKSHLIRQTAATQANLEDYRSDLKRIVGEAVEQLGSTARDITSGALRLPGLAPRDITLLAPTVVGLQEIPPDLFTGRALGSLVGQSEVKNGNLRQLPIQTIDVGTLEALLPCLKPERGLADFLTGMAEQSEKLKHPISARNYFNVSFVGDVPLNGYLEQSVERLKQEALSFWERRRVAPVAGSPDPISNSQRV